MNFTTIQQIDDEIALLKKQPSKAGESARPMMNRINLLNSLKGYLTKIEHVEQEIANSKNDPNITPNDIAFLRQEIQRIVVEANSRAKKEGFDYTISASGVQNSSGVQQPNTGKPLLPQLMPSYSAGENPYALAQQAIDRAANPNTRAKGGMTVEKDKDGKIVKTIEPWRNYITILQNELQKYVKGANAVDKDDEAAIERYVRNWLDKYKGSFTTIESRSALKTSVATLLMQIAKGRYTL